MPKTAFSAQIQQIPTESLIAYFNNVKTHPDSQIDKIISSIAEFGFTVPIVIDGGSVVIAGHGRLAAAKKMQLKTVPCIVRDDLTAAQVKALRIADNKVAESPWDDAALKLELEALAEMDFDLTLTGWDTEDLSAFDLDVDFQGSQVVGGEADEDEDEEAIADLLDATDEGAIASRVKLGEIWQLGRHRICCADSTNEENVRKLLGDRAVGMVWADPPYGISIVHGSRIGGNKRGHIKGRPDQKFGTNPTNEYAPVIGDETTNTSIAAFALCSMFEAVQIWWGGNYYSSILPDSSCWIIWDKENTGNFADAELAWTNQPSAVRIFKHMWNGMIKASEGGQRRVHPTQKPIALAEWCFEKYGKPDNLIFDPFLGSGISLIAAQQMEGDRTVYGFELSEAYCEVVLQRWEALTGVEPVLIGTL